MANAVLTACLRCDKFSAITTGKEVSMAEIAWKSEIDASLKEAKSSGKPVLLDFSHAPQ